MKVTRISPLVYTVKLTPEELELMQKDISVPADWFVKDPATLMQYVLERHVDYCELRHKK